MDNGIAFVTGRLSRDPQFFGEGDKRRAVFTVAYNRGRGERRKSTFIDCIAWGRMADFMESFNKGDGIHVNGDIEMDSWEKDGQKRTRLQVNISSITATTTFGDRTDGGTGTGGSNSSSEEETADIGF